MHQGLPSGLDGRGPGAARRLRVLLVVAVVITAKQPAPGPDTQASHENGDQKALPGPLPYANRDNVEH